MAREFLHDDRIARPAILTLVVGAHVVALLVILAKPLILLYTSDVSSTLVLVPFDYIEEWPELFKRPIKPTVGPIEPVPPPSLNFQSEPAAISDEGSAPDWKQSGSAAAADAAEREQNYRSLGPKAGEPHVKAPRSPFGPPPRHKAGEVGEDALENRVIWLSENCYLRPSNRRAPAGDPFADIPMTLCSFPIGKLEPKGDLFDHLRKQPPEP